MKTAPKWSLTTSELTCTCTPWAASEVCFFAFARLQIFCAGVRSDTTEICAIGIRAHDDTERSFDDLYDIERFFLRPHILGSVVYERVCPCSKLDTEHDIVLATMKACLKLLVGPFQ